MNKRFISLATPAVQQLMPYLPGKPVEELERELGIHDAIKLASNENPLGPSPLALQALQKQLARVNYYPDGGGFVLSQRIAEANNVAISNVTLGNGSNDILELVTRAYLTSADSAVFSAYSFAVYPIVVQAVGAQANVASAYPESHELMPLGHDPDAIINSIDEKTRIIFIANPNNPTGTWLSPEQLLALFERIADDIIIVLDLAYMEYMDKALQPDIAAWLKRFPNLVITRTFSKVYALAGLRIGYSLTHPDIADILNRVRQPFNTNSLAQTAALASLEDTDHLQKSIAMNTAGKTMLESAFDAMQLSYLPTMGNFISVNVKQNGLDLYARLLKRGIILRPVASYQMPEFLRITIGTQAQNQRLLKALSEELG